MITVPGAAEMLKNRKGACRQIAVIFFKRTGKIPEKGVSNE